MKILHTSDWHLGHQLYGFDRMEEQRDLMDQLVRWVDERKPDVFLVSGDVYHTGQPSAAVQTLFAQTLMRLHEVHPTLTVVVTAGNHDSASRHEVFRRPWEALGVFTIGQLDRTHPERHIIERPGIGFVVALPYVHESLLPRDFVPDLLERVAKRNPEGLPVVLSAHLTVQGADFTGHEVRNGKTRNSTALNDMPRNGTAENGTAQTAGEVVETSFSVGGIDAYRLEDLGEGYDYLALGHIHRPQFVDRASQRARYCGTPLPVSFDEAYPHSVSWVELDGRGAKPRVTAVELHNVHPLVTLPARGTATWEEAQELLRDFPKEEPAYLRVKVKVEDFLPIEAQRTAEALVRDKACRLCLLQPVREATATSAATGLSVEEFRQEAPIDIVRRYALDLGVTLDEDMERLFREAETAANDRLSDEAIEHRTKPSKKE